MVGLSSFLSANSSDTSVTSVCGFHSYHGPIDEDESEAEVARQQIENGAIRRARQRLVDSRLEIRNAGIVRDEDGRDCNRMGVRDAEDGVRRCVDCAWELESGRCGGWYVNRSFSRPKLHGLFLESLRSGVDTNADDTLLVFC